MVKLAGFKEATKSIEFKGRDQNITIPLLKADNMAPAPAPVAAATPQPAAPAPEKKEKQASSGSSHHSSSGGGSEHAAAKSGGDKKEKGEGGGGGGNKKDKDDVLTPDFETHALRRQPSAPPRIVFPTTRSKNHNVDKTTSVAEPPI